MLPDDSNRSEKNCDGIDKNESSEDVVDFALPKSKLCNDVTAIKSSCDNQLWHSTTKSPLDNGRSDDETKSNNTQPSYNPVLLQQQQQPIPTKQDLCSLKHQLWTSTIDKQLPILKFARKKSDPTNQHATLIAKDKPKFVKCASIARLFGNTYSTQQAIAAQKEDATKHRVLFSNHSSNARAPAKIERFKHCPESQIDSLALCETNTNDGLTTALVKDFCDEKDLGVRAFRTISKGFGRIWRRSHSIEISSPDPEYKVFYLGNVLTGWAKGESCVEKPLATLWRNYTQNNKPDVAMRILLCPSGLKATTRQHGLTEYWSNRITHCSAPKNYPRVFCFIYRHEGRKLKHELRCHAVLCPKESVAEQICKTLKENLTRALKEFKRDKINRQNARLSLANSLYENPSMPRRKILLSVGANNYRPPMERSKSAPKLMAIEEAVGEEDEEVSEEIGPNHSPRCNANPLFSAMTVGRKQCKRTKASLESLSLNRSQVLRDKTRLRCVSFDDEPSKIDVHPSSGASDSVKTRNANEKIGKHLPSHCSDEDEEFNSLLLVNDYDSKSSLSGELMSYFDKKLKLKTALSQNELNTRPDAEEVNTNTNALSADSRTAISLDNLDVLADHKFHSDTPNFAFDKFHSTNSFYDDESDNAFYSQNEIIDCLVNVSNAKSINSANKLASSSAKIGVNEAQRKDEATNSMVRPTINALSSMVILDSDEGSITSGCETSSTVTTTHFDDLLKPESNDGGAESPCTTAALHSMHKDKVMSTNFHSVQLQAVEQQINDDDIEQHVTTNNNNDEDCSSEISDESGFDEFQNCIGKRGSFNKREQCKKSSINDSKNCNQHDTNNNSKCFNSNTKVSTGRLMINIPKNAKSILI